VTRVETFIWRLLPILFIQNWLTHLNKTIKLIKYDLRNI